MAQQRKIGNSDKSMTAVEWIAEKMKKLTPPGYQIEFSYILQKAKQMEKEQIVQAYQDDKFHCSYHGGVQYYNETYGNEGV